jgi:outer membrane protein OmpA-like peptidoglycan-associated protein/tetratricopeptide (TPR) repeat protein
MFHKETTHMHKFISVFIVLIPILSFAQITTKENAKGNAKEFFFRADNDFAFGKLEQADSLLKLAVTEKDNFIDAWILIGQINLEYLRNFKRATDAFEKVKLLQANYLTDVEFQLGKCYINQGKYEQAETHLQAYLKQEKLPAQSKMLSDKMLSDCVFAKDAKQHPVDFKPINLGDGVNTADDESMPSLTADGRYLYFTRHIGFGRMQDEDVYVSENVNGTFTKAVSAGNTINTDEYIEGAQSVSPSGKYLFFTSADRRDGEGRADIYMSRKVGEYWERPNNMGIAINSPGWDAQPCISADSRTLFFASVRQTGEGGSDIYVSYYDDKTGWSKPQNLGRNINTMYDEMRPFIHPDGQTLYFSSNGHPGMGNFDIFVSRKQADGTWGKPMNLGYPINTPGDEIGIHVSADGGKAFYASEQADSRGQMDIYSFDMPTVSKPSYTSYIRGVVYDADSREPILANVQVYDVETGKLYATFSGDKVNGVFLSTLPSGRNYAVEVMKDGYLFYSEHISLKNAEDGKPFELSIPLHKINVGKTVVLNNVFFESDKYELQPQSKSELGVMVKMMEKNPTLKIEIGGHTDNTGTETKNLALSEERAKSVYTYLQQQGVDAARLSYKGYASSKPIAPNDTPQGKAKNRRTEFLVTGI